MQVNIWSDDLLLRRPTTYFWVLHLCHTTFNYHGPIPASPVLTDDLKYNLSVQEESSCFGATMTLTSVQNTFMFDSGSENIFPSSAKMCTRYDIFLSNSVAKTWQPPHQMKFPDTTNIKSHHATSDINIPQIMHLRPKVIKYTLVPKP